MGFSRRLALFLVVTLIVVQVLTGLFSYSYLRHSLVEKEKADLAAATRAFTHQLDLLSASAADDVKVLSLDYALRQAIAVHDLATEVSALRNHGRRVGAARMVLVGLDGKIVADTGIAMRSAGSFEYRDLLDGVAGDSGSTLTVANGQVYWVIAVPVRAPVAIAYIAAYIPVDAVLLEKLRRISSVPRSIALISLGRDGHWTTDASTGGPTALHIPGNLRSPLAINTLMSRQGREFLTVSTRLETAATSAPVVAILGYPLDEALTPFRSIIWPVLGVLVAALLVALVGAVVIVRSVSQPLRDLAESAKRIAAGDYRPPARVDGKDELGHLSDALIAMTRSIAEREQALTSAFDAAELARSEAERANHAKSEFLSNMSHELRTPLNAIVGFGQMLQHQMLGPIGIARYVEYARHIGTSAQHLLDLISRMLDLAEAERGSLAIAQEWFTVSGVLRQSARAAEAMATAAGVMLSFDESAADAAINGDAAKLGRAFSNLIHNAIKFTPSGGRVTVVSAIEGTLFKVRIEDTGVGMSGEDIAVITKPFHRLRSALDGNHQGAGLGLPLARTVIELHGGSLAIESAPGVGTTVRIALPLSGVAKADAA